MNYHFILDIILIGLVVFVAFFKSYFTEKGKNIATSEDIEELTEKVESVKQEFVEKNMMLKARLDILSNVSFSHKNDERIALIEFHQKYTIWVSALTESLPHLLNNNDENEIKKKLYRYHILYEEVRMSEALIHIYVPDTDLVNLIHNLISTTLKQLGSHGSDYLLKLNEFQQKIKSGENTSSEQYEAIQKEFREICELYQNKLIESRKIQIKSELKYKDRLKTYLSKTYKDLTTPNKT